jgi:hypothetical protein
MTLEKIATSSLILTNFTPGTPIQLTSDITIIVDKLSLLADEDNAGKIFLGDSGSATYPMIPGKEVGLDQFLSFLKDNLSFLKDKDVQVTATGIFVDAENALDKLHLLFWDVVTV